LTILVDDHQGRDGLLAEHGLSFWIETGGKHVLFDTGQESALEPNSLALGIDLAETDDIVLSHGHYDHTGGLAFALSRAPKAEVFCHPEVTKLRYAIRDGTPKQVQMPRDSVEALGRVHDRRLHRVQQPAFISGEIGVTGPIPRESNFEDAGGPFFFDPEGKHPDQIDDDLALWIRRDDGIIVCVGCAHAGLVNTLNFIGKLNTGLKIRAVVGGFHLLQAGRDRLARTMSALRPLDLELVVPCHCTGESAIGVLGEAFPDRVLQGAVGMTLRF